MFIEFLESFAKNYDILLNELIFGSTEIMRMLLYIRNPYAIRLWNICILALFSFMEFMNVDFVVIYITFVNHVLR